MQQPRSQPAADRASNAPGADTPRPLHVLLVSDDSRWIVVVREAVAAAGGVVETVSVSAAIARLAGQCDDLSHVLVDRLSADGWLETLADLTTDTASAATLLMVLGPPAFGPDGPRTILSANRRAVTAALATRHIRPGENLPELPTSELVRVIEAGMIRTRYQPIVRMADRATTTVEVLARLHHPEHGGLTPDWFVPRFEDSGLSFTLTELVSSHAFADLTGPGLRGLGIAVALNYPLNVLSHPEAAASLDRKRASLGMTADQVVVELTESLPVEDFDSLTRSMETLRGLGYGIAIDDAGPGVKDLDRLLTLPFTSLKLDKGVVRLHGMRGPGASYAPKLIEQAHARGLNVVAEGVESQETWDRLAALGAQEAQGFFISRPLPAAAMPVWLEGWRDASAR